MVEGASIDKQSHPNQAAGTIWDTIEFDKAVGVARAWAAKRNPKDTLIVVTADHDQSMSIIGVSNTPDAEYFNRTKSEKVAWQHRSRRPGHYRVRAIPTPMLAPGCRSSTAAPPHPTTRRHSICPVPFRSRSHADTSGTQHLLDLLGIPGLHAGSRDRLPGQHSGIRRNHAPVGGGFPHRRSYRLQRSRHRRGHRAHSCSPATWIRPTSSSKWLPPPQAIRRTETGLSIRFSPTAGTRKL